MRLPPFFSERIKLTCVRNNRPSETTDSVTGTTTQTTETWIWFLISRPLYTPSSSLPKTPLLPNTDPFTPPKSGFTEYHTPPPFAPPHQHVPEPNLPFPIPTSTLVFALPKGNCSTYPIVTESFPSSATTAKGKENVPFVQMQGRHPYDKPLPVPSSLQESLVFKHPYDKPKNSPSIFTPSQILNKRTDIDLSFSGLPIFEFSPKSAEHELSTFAAYVTSLSNRSEVQGWSVGRYEEELRRLEGVFERGVEGEWVGVDLQGKGFNEGLVEEIERWQAVRSAMGRGKLRLVVRWQESAGKGREEEFEGMGESTPMFIFPLLSNMADLNQGLT